MNRLPYWPVTVLCMAAMASRLFFPQYFSQDFILFVALIFISRIIATIVMRIPLGHPVSSVLVNHGHKQGTKTMGGIIFWLCPAILLFFESGSMWTKCSVLSALVVGIIDDLCKSFSQNNRGLSKSYKLFGFALGLSILYFIFIDNTFYSNIFSIFRFILNITVTMLFIAAYSITDGLDGLLASIVILPLVYCCIAFNYSVFYLSLFAGLFVFMFYNRNPAQIFMGEVGAMPLGALVGSFFLQAPVQIGLISLVPLINLASVGLKIYLAKLGIRYNILAPIHHEIEKHVGERLTVVILFIITFILFSFAIYIDFTSIGRHIDFLTGFFNNYSVKGY